LLPAGVVLAIVWVAWERAYKKRGKSPMVDLAIFRERSFSSGIALATVYFIGITAVWVIIAIYLQLGLGMSALDAGLIGLPSALCGAFSARWSGRHVMTIGRKLVSAGVTIAILGLLATIVVLHLSAAGVVSVWWILVTL